MAGNALDQTIGAESSLGLVPTNTAAGAVRVGANPAGSGYEVHGRLTQLPAEQPNSVVLQALAVVSSRGANRLAEQLERDRLRTAIDGNKSQGARTRALAGFKQGVVATCSCEARRFGVRSADTDGRGGVRRLPPNTVCVRPRMGHNAAVSLTASMGISETELLVLSGVGSARFRGLIPLARRLER